MWSISPKPIFLKFGKNDDLNHVTPRAKNGGRPKRGVAWGISEVVRSRAFYFFKSSFNASTAFHEKRASTQSPPQNVFWWWVLKGHFALSYPKTPFLYGPIFARN